MDNGFPVILVAVFRCVIFIGGRMLPSFATKNKKDTTSPWWYCLLLVAGGILHQQIYGILVTCAIARVWLRTSRQSIVIWGLYESPTS